MYFQKTGLTASSIAAAIALAVIYDIKVRNIGLTEFPAIPVRYDATDDSFVIGLVHNGDSVTFRMTKAEAIAAVKHMNEHGVHHQPIFGRVEMALAKIERKSNHREIN